MDFPIADVAINPVLLLLLGLLIGILGGFTTFSAFGYETFAMLREAEYLRAILNVGVQVLLGLALVWLGYNLATSR